MHAWSKDGSPADHPEPWGLPGVFSTLRRFPQGHIAFRDEYLERLLDSAKRSGMNWIPPKKNLSERLDEFLAIETCPPDGLVRLCLFDDRLGISSRPALSDGNPVKGLLLEYRRPEPQVKSTGDAQLYGRLSELDITCEDWIIIDPEKKDIRESATCNLIFVRDKELLIPESAILPGIVLQKLLPYLESEFSVTRGSPQANEIPEFEEIILCGTGRGIAPLDALPELEWTSSNDQVFQKARSQYEELVQP